MSSGSQEQYDQTAKLTKDVETRDGHIEQLKQTHAKEVAISYAAQLKAERERDSAKKQIDELNKQLASLELNNEKLTARIAKYEPPLKASDTTAASASDAGTDRSIWWYVGGGILAAVIVVAGAWLGGKLLSERETEASEEKPPMRENSADEQKVEKSSENEYPILSTCEPTLNSFEDEDEDDETRRDRDAEP